MHSIACMQKQQAASSHVMGPVHACHQASGGASLQRCPCRLHRALKSALADTGGIKGRAWLGTGRW